MSPVIFAILLAVLIGLSLGVLGSGGSIVTLPVLVYVAGLPADKAVAMSLAVVGATSLVGSVLSWRRRQIRTRETVWFATAGMLGAYLGSQGTHLVSQVALMLVFAALMLIVGVRMIGYPIYAAVEKPSLGLLSLASLGFGVGVVTGFVGVGGGFLIVPALVLFAGFDLKSAVGSSLAIIALTSLAGLCGQLRYVSMDWSLTLAFLAASLTGLLAGSALVAKIPHTILRHAFGWSVLAVGCLIAAINLREIALLT